MQTIKGDRICPICRGIVPKGKVLREKHGQRKRYFDTKSCALKWACKQSNIEFDDWMQVANQFELVNHI